jgi:transcriptional regulator with XRE-family HTH domain
MDKLARRVGERVRSLRTDQGLTIEQLAAASELPAESVGRVERAEHVASIGTLAKIAEGLGVELTSLLGGERRGRSRQATVPSSVRGVAMLLVGEPPDTIEDARRLIEVLLANRRRAKSAGGRRGRR